MRWSKAIRKGDLEKANRLKNILDPLFKLVTVNTIESYEGFKVPAKFRNPVPDQDDDEGTRYAIRTLPPPSWQDDAQRESRSSEMRSKRFMRRIEKILRPIQEFYKVNIEERLSNDRYWK